MLRLAFTHKALQDVQRLREFIAKKNPQAASRAAKRLHSALSRLADQPHLGRALEQPPGLT